MLPQIAASRRRDGAIFNTFFVHMAEFAPPCVIVGGKTSRRGEIYRLSQNMSQSIQLNMTRTDQQTRDPG
tara:strand:- start:151012 stop:151221 length:210 start_codon:yes stop_codon:yes gene_type:complete